MAPDGSSVDDREELLREELASSIAELRATEEELVRRNDDLADALLEAEAERQRYFTLLRSAPIAYVLTDAGGKVLDANPNAARLLNVETRFLLDKPLAVFVTLDRRRDFREALARCRVGGTPLALELELAPRAGAAVTVDATVDAVVAPDGGIETLR